MGGSTLCKRFCNGVLVDVVNEVRMPPVGRIFRMPSRVHSMPAQVCNCACCRQSTRSFAVVLSMRSSNSKTMRRTPWH
jgi:hypothetical protein